MAVLDQVKKERSNERLPTEDILQKEAERAGIDFETLYQSLFDGIESGKIRIMRANNTLFIYEIVQPGIAHFDIASADPDKVFPQSVQEFMKAMKIAGFKRISTSTTNAALSKALQAVTPVKSIRQVMDETGKPEYEMIVEVM
jgi:hypothetical protein